EGRQRVRGQEGTRAHRRVLPCWGLLGGGNGANIIAAPGDWTQMAWRRGLLRRAACTECSVQRGQVATGRSGHHHLEPARSSREAGTCERQRAGVECSAEGKGRQEAR